ncbi:hypothetical protein Tco_1271042 [Tanacetum coccineum]
MIGSLMYLTSSRPDIMFAVCACARFQINPKISHLHAVKRIFRYLKGQPRLGLWYPKDSPFDLVAYTDNDYAGASLDRKSITGGCQFLRCRLISWQCKKQTVVANSTTEAEYIAASNCPITVPSSSQPKKTFKHKKPKKVIEIPQSSEPTTLVADKVVHEERGDSMERVATTASSLEVEQDNGGRPRRQETMGDRPAQTRIELKELMEICTKLSERVLDLEKAKTAQAKEIASLKKRVKKLEMRRRSRTPGMNLFKIDMDEAIEHVYEADKDVDGDVEQVISSVADEVSTGDAVNTVGTEVNTASAPVTTIGVVSVSTAKTITTASEVITTAEPNTPPTTTTIFEDEDLTIAQTLVKMKSEKSKIRGVIMKESSETATRPTDDVQAMMDAYYELAARLHVEEQEELTIKEKSKLFVELMDKRKKHFARLRAEEQRRKLLTKAQKRSQIWINSSVPMDSEVVKGSKDRAEGSETKVEGSSKRAREDLQKESTKKQKVDDDDKEKTILSNVLRLKGKHGYYEIIRADGSSKIYFLFSQLIKSFDIEDLETLWKLVKAKHGYTRLEEGYERVLWGDLKTMFEHHVEDAVWKNLQEKKVLL